MSDIYGTLQYLDAQRKTIDNGETSVPAIDRLDLQERSVPVARSSAHPLLERVQGLFAIADQLQRALATVSQLELDSAEADLERAANQVRAMKENVRQLKTVKADLEELAGLTRR
jgi:hypothetical protein